MGKWQFMVRYGIMLGDVICLGRCQRGWSVVK